MFFSAFLAFLASGHTVAPGGVGWTLIVMALLYPASAVIVQRRFGSGLLPGVAMLALLAYAVPVSAAIAALPVSGRLIVLTATSALAPTVLPVTFATAAIWHLTREARTAAPALQLAGGVVAFLAGVPVAAMTIAVAAIAL